MADVLIIDVDESIFVRYQTPSGMSTACRQVGDWRLVDKVKTGKFSYRSTGAD